MDKKLELRLIESGYQPNVAQELTLDEVGTIICGMGSIRSNGKSGVIFFDGETQAIVRTGWSHSIMKKSGIAVRRGENSAGLYIYSVLDDANDERESIYVENPQKDSNTSVKIGPSYDSSGCLNFEIRNRVPFDLKKAKNIASIFIEKDSPAAEIQFLKADETAVLYLPPADDMTKDKLFWEYVAEQVGLKLTKIDPQYTDKLPITPWYSAKDEKSETELTLGTRWRVYSVIASVPTKKSAEDLRSIVDGLNVNLQTIDNEWIGGKISKNGKTFETHIGRGDQVVAYLDRLLKK